MIADRELRELVFKTEGSLSPLTAEEYMVLYEFSLWRYAGWEHAHLEWNAGIISEELWIGRDGVYRHIVEGKPGYPEYFRRTRPQWDTRFLHHLEKVVNIGPDT